MSAAELAALLQLVADGTISGTNAKEVFAEHFGSGAPVASIVERRGLRQISDAGVLGAAVEQVLAANPAAVADYRAGTTAADRLPGRPGHEGNSRTGQRGHGPGRAARTAGQVRVGGEAIVTALNLALWVLGVVLIAVGYSRARGPWSRYQQLKSQEANIARYEGWRGTRLRTTAPAPPRSWPRSCGPGSGSGARSCSWAWS